MHVTGSTQPVAEQVFQDPGHRAAAHCPIRADDGPVSLQVTVWIRRRVVRQRPG